MPQRQCQAAQRPPSLVLQLLGKQRQHQGLTSMQQQARAARALQRKRKPLQQKQKQSRSPSAGGQAEALLPARPVWRAWAQPMACSAPSPLLLRQGLQTGPLSQIQGLRLPCLLPCQGRLQQQRLLRLAAAAQRLVMLLPAAQAAAAVWQHLSAATRQCCLAARPQPTCQQYTLLHLLRRLCLASACTQASCCAVQPTPCRVR